MKSFKTGMVVTGLFLAGLMVGCNQQKAAEPVVAAPEQQPLPVFPEEQVPQPEPQPVAAPVDTTATTAQPEPAAQPKESYAPPVKKAARTYVVKKGDTLQKISMKFYKTTKKWRTVYNANKKTLAKGPDKLQAGMKLVIP